MAKNNYAKVMQAKIREHDRALRLFTMQWCADAAILAARDVFQRKGDKLAEFGEKFFEYAQQIAEMTLEDADGDKEIQYVKYKVDEALKSALGDKHFVPWEERYNL